MLTVVRCSLLVVAALLVARAEAQVRGAVPETKVESKRKKKRGGVAKVWARRIRCHRDGSVFVLVSGNRIVQFSSNLERVIREFNVKLDRRRARIHDFVLSSDGRTLCFSASDNTVRCHDLGSGKETSKRFLWGAGSPVVVTPQTLNISADGRQVAGGRNARVLLEVDNKKQAVTRIWKVLADARSFANSVAWIPARKSLVFAAAPPRSDFEKHSPLVEFREARRNAEKSEIRYQRSANFGNTRNRYEGIGARLTGVSGQGAFVYCHRPYAEYWTVVGDNWRSVQLAAPRNANDPRPLTSLTIKNCTLLAIHWVSPKTQLVRVYEVSQTHKSAKVLLEVATPNGTDAEFASDGKSIVFGRFTLERWNIKASSKTHQRNLNPAK